MITESVTCTCDRCGIVVTVPPKNAGANADLPKEWRVLAWLHTGTNLVEYHLCISCAEVIQKALIRTEGGLHELVTGAACDRIRTLANEAFGPFSVQSTDEAIEAIELGISTLRAQRDHLRTEIAKLNDQPRPLRSSPSTVYSAKGDAEAIVEKFNAGEASAIAVASHVPALIARITDLELAVTDRGNSYAAVKDEYNKLAKDFSALQKGTFASSPTVEPVTKLAAALANRGITSEGMGALSLDVVMARKHGWSDEQIATVMEK